LGSVSEEEEDEEILVKSHVDENGEQFHGVDVAISQVGISGIVGMASILVSRTRSFEDTFNSAEALTFYLAPSCTNPLVPHTRSAISTFAHVQ